MSEEEISKARWHNGAESRYMAHADNWVMVRRPGCIPYCVFKRDWLKLPLAADGAAMEAAYRKALSTPTPDRGK